MFEKSATELKLKQKLLKFKSTIQIVSFNVRTLNRIGKLPELTASVIDKNIDIICIQDTFIAKILNTTITELSRQRYDWAYEGMRPDQLQQPYTMTGLGLTTGILEINIR